MKIVKGSKWLKCDFMEQLEQLFETNHVVEIDKLVDFDGKEQFIKNMLIRTDIAIATESDIEQQTKIENDLQKKALGNTEYRDKLRQEEKQLRKKMGL